LLEDQRPALIGMLPPRKLTVVLLLACVCAFCSAAPGAPRSPSYEDITAPDLKGIHLTIVTVGDAPFISVFDNPDAKLCDATNLADGCKKVMSSSEWNGWIINILAELSAASGFTYSLQLPATGDTYGKADHDMSHSLDPSVYAENTKNGRGGDEFFRGTSKYDRAHMHPAFEGGNGTAPTCMFSAAYITPNRIKNAVAVAPFYQSPLSLLLRKPEKDWKTQSFQWIRPFSDNLWILLILVGISHFCCFSAISHPPPPNPILPTLGPHLSLHL
jgi:hypothetical protein